MITGAQAMVECLKREGVALVFGYPGAAILPFYESMSGSGIRHVLTRSEQGAGHAASGYARISGRPGVCVATSGPGATNLFTAIATAWSDSIPLVAITGQVVTNQLGRDVFQEVDTTGAVAPFAKYSYLVKSASELGRVFKEAFHIASTGRKGPVLIDVPVDIQQEAVDFTYPESVSIRGYKPRFEGHGLQVRRVVEAIRASKRPLLCCGGGVQLADASERVRRLCEEGSIPAVSTMMGLGAFPRSHPLYFGMLGQSGDRTANAAVEESDLLILMGARVGDRAIRKPASLEAEKTIIHIDIDTAEIGKNMAAEIPLVGDAGKIAEQLTDLGVTGDRIGWLDYLCGLRETELAKQRAALSGPKKNNINPATFVRTLCEKLPVDAVYVADVGQNQIWSAGNFSASGRFLTTGGMGTMGYAIPAAVGAQLAGPGRTIVAVCGDGGFQMSMNELATICQNSLPVKLVVMNNGILGLIKELQGDAVFSVELDGGPNLGKIAGAYGIAFERLIENEDAAAAVDRMLRHDGPFLLECVVDPDEVTR